MYTRDTPSFTVRLTDILSTAIFEYWIISVIVSLCYLMPYGIYQATFGYFGIFKNGDLYLSLLIILCYVVVALTAPVSFFLITYYDLSLFDIISKYIVCKLRRG